MRNVDGMMTKGGRDDWETPPEVFDPLNREFGFELDVCASTENTKCSRFYSKNDDALAQQWAGVCWMNPPYGLGLPRWIRKAYESSRLGATVVCLVPARTDTAWWHDYVENKAEQRFVRRRIRFIGAPFTAPFPSVVLVYRPTVEQIAA